MNFRLLTCIICCCLPLAYLSAEESSSDKSNADKDAQALRIQTELQALEDEINNFRSMLNNTQGQKSNLENTLETNEKDISEILNNIKDIQKDLTKGEKKVSKLRLQSKHLLDQKLEQQTLIAKQIRASYELGNQEYIKVVLNQGDPNKLARMMKYYQYFNQARLQQIDSYEVTLLEITQIEDQLAKQNQELISKRAQLDQQQSGLVVIQNENKLVLRDLNQEIAQTGSEIKNRLQNREHLESLLERITASSADFAMQAESKPFSNMKGGLFLPVSGKITHKYGSKRNDGKLRWDGIFIEADEGEPVHSVHYGRVVFSDWLRGFGLLLIINHGEGYMSLYGHNQVLYRETGDWVAPGELVADVGNSGGLSNSGLYFEVRKAGKPSNPQLWCRAA